MKQGNFIYMLASLLALLLLAPSMAKYFPPGSSIFIQITFMTLMVIGVWSLKGNSIWFRVGLVLAGAGILLSILNFFVVSNLVYMIGLVNVFLFCLMSSVVVMKQVMFKGKIDMNKLVGSVCIYLLLGLIWGIAFSLIAIIEPAAFKGTEQISNRTDLWDYIYYSFVTLTTLGYGDISPVYPLVKSLAYLEAICGQLYIAILVASMVGAYLTEQKTDTQT